MGIGEVARGIVGKAVMNVVKLDLQQAIGSIQLYMCAGKYAGCKAAVHAMEQLFAVDDTEAMILVDTTNAFNLLNRQVTLLNCDKICLAIAHIIINTYRNNSSFRRGPLPIIGGRHHSRRSIGNGNVCHRHITNDSSFRWHRQTDLACR